MSAPRILEVDDEYGSIEPGKAADLVLYDGDPFEYATQTTHVIVAGEVAFDRSTEPPIPLARRAYLSAPEVPCCLGW